MKRLFSSLFLFMIVHESKINIRQKRKKKKKWFQVRKIYARIRRRHGLVLLKVGNQMKRTFREKSEENFQFWGKISALVRRRQQHFYFTYIYLLSDSIFNPSSFDSTLFFLISAPFSVQFSRVFVTSIWTCSYQSENSLEHSWYNSNVWRSNYEQSYYSSKVVSANNIQVNKKYRKMCGELDENMLTQAKSERWRHHERISAKWIWNFFITWDISTSHKKYEISKRKIRQVFILKSSSFVISIFNFYQNVKIYFLLRQTSRMFDFDTL